MGTSSTGSKENLSDSKKEADSSNSKSDPSSSGLGSLGMLGDYSSSEDSDE